VKEELIEQTATIGENIQAGRFVKYDLAGKPGLIHAYIHPPGKIGVLLHLELSDASLAGKAEVKQLAQDICLHIAASAPLAVDKDSVDASVLEAEKEIFKNQAMNEGKPEHIAEKIVEGRIKKFYEESCLLEQPFVKDPDTKVDGLLAKVGKEVGGEIKVAGFSRLAVGENAPKEEEDE
jgi:elongation factor Ts